LVRSRLTVAKRGAFSKIVPLHIDDLYWLSDRSLYSNGVHVVETIETIVTIAIMKVGFKRSDALIKALLYNWRTTKLEPEQIKLMKHLGRDRIATRKLVSSFIDELRYRLPSGKFIPEEHVLERIDGVWKSAGGDIIK
jgi:hypothetical protein